MATYDIAIITVTYNRLDDACLRSVRAILDSSPLKIAYVVVDNGSPDIDVHAKVRPIIPEAEIILRKDNHGFGRSCNLAAREVDAKYFFFLNPDTEPGVELMHALHAFLEAHPQVGITAPRMTYDNGILQPTCRRFPRWYSPMVERLNFFSERLRTKHRAEFHMEDYRHVERRMVDWVQGSAMMISSALFREIGGFDDRYRMYIEDVDLCRESWSRHRPVYYLPDHSMKHTYVKASAATKGIVRSLLTNHAMRWHIESWLKYEWKWFWRRIRRGADSYVPHPRH